MIRTQTAALCVGFVLSATSSDMAWAEGGALHLFGPAGTATERRVLAVLEGDDGRCLPWDDVSVVSVDSGVSVVQQERMSECVTWLEVTTEEPLETVTLQASSPDTASTSTLALSSEESLLIRVSRSGRRIAVRIGRGAANEQLSAHAFWNGGTVELEPTSVGVYRGTVPANEVVGIVARSGGVVGATMSIPESFRGNGVAVVVMPSELSVPAGGAPRTAAFLVVTDQRGRLSNTVPLSITSERGRLRGMRWLRRGLAAIQLSTDVGTTSVDLSVSFQEELFGSIELPVSAGWPVSASLEVPGTVTAGEAFESTISATSLNGEVSHLDDLRVRCGGEEREPDEGGAVSCTLNESDPEASIVVGAHIDGRFVPLGSRRVDVHVPPPERIEQPAEAGGDGPRYSEEPRVRFGPFLQGGLDLFWIRGSATLGIRVELPFFRWFHLGLSASYTLTPFNNQPASSVNTGPLEGFQHTTELVIAGGFEFFGRRVTMVVRGGFGVAYAALRATVGDSDASGQAVRATMAVSLGPRFNFERSKLGLEVGVRVPLASTDGTWDEPPLRIMMEASYVVGFGG